MPHEAFVPSLLVLAALSVSQACVHDNMKFKKPIRGMQRYFAEGDARRTSGQLSPIRIEFDLHRIQQPDIPLEAQEYVTSLVNYTKERFQKALSVQSIVGNLLIPRNCSEFLTKGAHNGKCEIASPENWCHDVEIPQDHLGALTTWTSSGESDSIPAGSGIPADLLIYVTYSATDCEGAVAFAASCRTDQNDRPFAGIINFCPEVVKPTVDPLAIVSDQDTALHEITHVLGFNSDLYSLFRDENGSPRTPRCPDAPGCTLTDQDGLPPTDPSSGLYITSNSTVLPSARRGAPISFLVTPAVQRVAREYFACPDVPGAELENDGDKGSAGSHFEKRALFNELMNPSRTPSYRLVLSNFTLAVLEDSGWYAVDYAAADPAFKFGRGLGCGFLDTDCSGAGAGFPYCLPGQGFGCSFDQSGFGKCFTDDPKMDGCGYTTFLERYRCDNATGMTPDVLHPCGEVDCAGSAPGPGSACFASTVKVPGQSGGFLSSLQPPPVQPLALLTIPPPRPPGHPAPLRGCEPDLSGTRGPRQRKASKTAATPTAAPAAKAAPQWQRRSSTLLACGGSAWSPTSCCLWRGATRVRSRARLRPMLCAAICRCSLRPVTRRRRRSVTRRRRPLVA